MSARLIVNDCLTAAYNSQLLTLRDYNRLKEVLRHLQVCGGRGRTAMHTVSDETLTGFVKILLKVLRYGEALTSELNEAHKLADHIDDSMCTLPAQNAVEASLVSTWKLGLLTEPYSDLNCLLLPTARKGIRNSKRVRDVLDREVKFDFEPLIVTDEINTPVQ
jgi:hypothetical protein